MRATNRWTIGMIIAMVVLGGWASAAKAEDEKETLRKRFEERFPKLLALKDQGKIGETYQGLVEAVKPEYQNDQTLSQLVNDENRDRRRLYEIVAKEQNTTPDRVAQRNAERNFRNASPEHWLKGSDGKWYQKKSKP
ncbi:MAG: YdbL family protein [Phycisphaeraceae bacterium]|nr:YdbL family protein [Phycisphaeraceae bacterium]